MSTRCQIGIYENAEQSISNPNALLYRHSDGYPDGDHGVVASIMPFLKLFKEKRGINDTEYLPARLIQYMCNKSDAALGDDGKKYGYDMLSYGVCEPHNFHGDIEFFYRIHPNELVVYSCSWDAEPKNYVEVEKHKI